MEASNASTGHRSREGWGRLQSRLRPAGGCSTTWLWRTLTPGGRSGRWQEPAGDSRPSSWMPSDEDAVVDLIRSERVDAVLNALDPRFVMPVFRAAFTAGVTYLDMAMSLSHPHPTDPYHLPGVKLGDEQFAMADQWEERGLLALCGIGVEPGLSDVFARYAADSLFSSIDEIGVRDGANLVIEGYEFAPSFSIWTTIEECLNPPVVWERGKEWFTTECFSEPETFVFPAGIGPVECVNVEHEEVLLDPPMGRCQPGHLQVRPGRRVHRHPLRPPQTGSRLHHSHPGRERRGLPSGRGCRLPSQSCRARGTGCPV